jgi:hypothetical protein
VKIRWANKIFYSGTVIGYTINKAMSLIYYDDRTVAQDNSYVHPKLDFYKLNLIDKKPAQWRLLEPIGTANNAIGFRF